MSLHKHAFVFLLALSIWGCQSPNGHAQDHEYSNHLIGESSPYLLQHAHNPVDWYPWGEEALTKAKKEDKMLLISIGYAACHWCHVMERESFEDTTVARLMNEHFVNIKVDREERPDIDDVYMTACQLATGEACGWPLNSFALPDGRPVWAGTYFPKKNWVEILEYFIKVKKEEPEKLDQYASQLVEGIAESDRMHIQPVETEEYEAGQLEEIADTFLDNIDFQRGGRKGSPKFPMPTAYEFLLEYHHLTADEKALEAVTTTLDQMAMGGIYDQLGGGFARYSTDEKWHVPHFEKMLYDNGQLVSLYAHAYQLTGKALYKQVIEETLAFINREMTGPEGGFYSSLDADSEGEEGKFYVWTQSEIDSVLADPALSELVSTYYNIEPSGNWEEGKNILRRTRSDEEVAQLAGLSVQALRESLAKARKKLFQARAERVRPGLDDKRLTSWNALMLRGYVDAYNAIGNPAYLKAALRNARFITDRMMEEDYRLRRNFKAEEAVINAFLDDYALTAQAFIALYQATFDTQWLRTARGLAEYARVHFYDEEPGLFYYTSDLDAPLVTRKMEINDNVIPGSNSTMALVLHDLGAYFYEPEYTAQATHMLQQITGAMKEAVDGAYFSNWSRLYIDLVKPPYEVAVLGPEFESKRRALVQHYLPQALLLGGETEGELELLKDKLQAGTTMIYVCQNKVCKLPVEEVDRALALMGHEE